MLDNNVLQETVVAAAPKRGLPMGAMLDDDDEEEEENEPVKRVCFYLFIQSGIAICLPNSLVNHAIQCVMIMH